MEIDITGFFKEVDPYCYSASAAELGENAGAITWNNALREGAEAPLLETEEQLQALRDHVRGFGAWGEEEIAAWSDSECNALLIQMISGDMRESGLDSCDFDEIDWDEYQDGVDAGQYAGRIYPGDDGKIYYYLGD